MSVVKERVTVIERLRTSAADGMHSELLLQLCYMNARSFNIQKVGYVNYVSQGIEIDLLCVTETGFSETVIDNTWALHDYK